MRKVNDTAGGRAEGRAYERSDVRPRGTQQGGCRLGLGTHTPSVPNLELSNLVGELVDFRDGTVSFLLKVGNLLLDHPRLHHHFVQLPPCANFKAGG